jgi:hypothetical protein
MKYFSPPESDDFRLQAARWIYFWSWLVEVMNAGGVCGIGSPSPSRWRASSMCRSHAGLRQPVRRDSLSLLLDCGLALITWSGRRSNRSEFPARAIFPSRSGLTLGTFERVRDFIANPRHRRLYVCQRNRIKDFPRFSKQASSLLGVYQEQKFFGGKSRGRRTR